MKYQLAPEIKKEINKLIEKLNFSHINPNRIFCIRSFNAKTRAYARIWGIGKLFKEVAGIEPCYIIEVNDRRFNKLSKRDQTKTLIHELLHIPKNFSGTLLPHRGKYHRINDVEIEKIIKDRSLNLSLNL